VRVKALKEPRVNARFRNAWERQYADHLEAKRVRGEILRWDYEPETLRLADRTTLCPDFRVVLPDGLIEFHEVKGFRREDAMIKIKVAAELHPYKFVLVQKVKGCWQPTEYP